ncbi:MAG: DUF1501 domain-containing protein [Gammaproteobacteria bacterium]|nr:DUF1501 domain-containing protein [Gammaproteobacteria bacterium]
MKRRDFMRMTATAGGLLACGNARLAFGQAAFSGPNWLFIEARGGWDPTSFCDPKGFGLGVNGDINNYDQNDIGQIGNIRYAPPPDSFANNTTLFKNQDFFEAHYQRLLVINGINYGTNSHSVGRTASWTGSRARNYPSIGALIASEEAPDLALPIVANSSAESSKTNGLVPRSLVRGSDLNAIREIAFPNRTNANQGNQYHSNGIRNLIESASAARRQRQIAEQRLLRIQRALALHDAGRNRDVSSLQGFVNNLNATSAPNSYVNSRSNARNLFNQAQTAFAAFEAGAAASAQIDIGGFDTHDDHDARHYPRLMDYLAAVDNIIDDAMARGIGNNLIIVMGSDFARTNKYNNDNGKDHWSHTSMMVWGAPAHFQGNRVVGATDDLQRSRKINPSTLALDNNGVEMSPEYIHQSLRSLAGIDMNPGVSGIFPFAEQVLPIFA